MGMVVAGRWTEEVPAEVGTGGEFRRIASAFRDRITADGSSGFPAAVGRYHLYVGYHCPWAHRTIIFRALKKLEDAISISYCLPYFRENGWTYELRPEAPDCTLDEIRYRLFVRSKIEKGLADIEAGRVYTQEQAKEQVRRWLASSGATPR